MNDLETGIIKAEESPFFRAALNPKLSPAANIIIGGAMRELNPKAPHDPQLEWLDALLKIKNLGREHGLIILEGLSMAANMEGGLSLFGVQTALRVYAQTYNLTLKGLETE